MVLYQICWNIVLHLKNDHTNHINLLHTSFYPSALRAGGVLSSRSGRAGGRAGGWVVGRAGGRAGGCQTCGTHISVTS